MDEKELVEQGCLDIWIDDIVPCLKETKTGKLKDTVVFKIESLGLILRSLRKRMVGI